MLMMRVLVQIINHVFGDKTVSFNHVIQLLYP